MVLLVSCNTVAPDSSTNDNLPEDTASCPEANSDSDKALEVYMGDTVNYMDATGLKQGIWLAWYDDYGTLKTQRQYRNDTLHGIYVDHDSTGNVIVDGKYYLGNKTGDWVYYSTDGTVDSTATY